MADKMRVLLVGWDAADWRVITPLLDGGHMPNLAGLVERGVCGRLATIQPPLSPMLWTSIATGKRAWKHGIHGFTEVDAATGGVRPISSHSRTCKAVWNILHQRGLTSHVCGWWPSHPAEPIRGGMVSNHYQTAVAPLDKPWPIRPGTVHPPELAEALAALRVHPHALTGDMLRHFVPGAPEIDQEKDRRLGSLAKILAECSSVHAAATHLMLHRLDWDFAGVYYDAIDHFSHGFMRYHPPRLEWVSEKDFRLYQGVINAAYVYHDMMLGALLRIAGPETTVLVISDHGFHPDHMRPRILPNEPAGPAMEHGPFGILVAAGPGLRRDATIEGASLLDITPTLLTAFGLPVGRDMDGSVLAGLWEAPPLVDYVDSWEAVEGDAGCHPANADLPPPDPAETLAALRQLEDLGYIEPVEGNVRDAAETTVRELRYNLARALLDGGNDAWAREIFEELWEKWPEESRFGVHLLRSQIEADMPVEARRTFDLLRRRKADAAAKAEKDCQGAIEKLKADIPAANAESDPGKTLAKGLAGLDENEQHRLRKLRARARTNPLAFAFLEGSLLALEGHPREALKLLADAACSQNASRPSALLKMAQIHATLREWTRAAELCNEALSLAPDDPVARFQSARARLALRHWGEAADEARIALGLRHFFPQAALVAGVALWRGGDAESAGHFLRRALDQNPVYPAAQYLMAAYCRKELRDPEAAKKHRRLAREAARRIRSLAVGQRPDGVHRDEFRASFLDADPRRPATSGPQSFAPPGEAIVIVTGLPRSGTSMMMQMLAAGGFPILTDNLRTADENNPLGYLEYGKAKSLHRDSAWLDEALGKAVKIVAPLLAHLPPPRPGRHYRIIALRRPLEEVASSQIRMLARLDKGKHLAPSAMLRILRRHLLEMMTLFNRWQTGGCLDVLDVNYHAALAAPSQTAALLQWFLGTETRFDPIGAAQAVTPELHREKHTH